MDDIVRMFKALANERRVEILREIIKEGEMTVSQVSEQLDISFVSASRHLLKLEQAGFLKNSQRGLWVYYRPNNQADRFSSALLKLVSQ